MSDPATPTDLAAYWQQHTDQWKNSGLSQTKFCQANDLPYHRFVYWRRKFELSMNGREETRESSE